MSLDLRPDAALVPVRHRKVTGPTLAQRDDMSPTPRTPGEDAAELALEQAVDALDLLLLAQLGGVVGQLAAARDRAVLARLLVELALGIERARRRLQAEVGAFAAGELAGGTDVTCHVLLLRPGASSADGSRCAGWA